MDTPETVQFTGTPDTSLACRITRNVNSGDGKKAPRFNYAISLPAPLNGLVVEGPIFKDESDGSFSVGLPGGRFAAIKPEQERITGADGKEYLLATKDPVGSRKMEMWGPSIKAALLDYLRGDGKEPDQRVAF